MRCADKSWHRRSEPETAAGRSQEESFRAGRKIRPDLETQLGAQKVETTREGLPAAKALWQEQRVPTGGEGSGLSAGVLQSLACSDAQFHECEKYSCATTEQSC